MVFCGSNFWFVGICAELWAAEAESCKDDFSIHESPALSPWATVMMMKDAWMGQETIRQRFPVASGLFVEQLCQQVVAVVLA